MSASTEHLKRILGVMQKDGTTIDSQTDLNTLTENNRKYYWSNSVPQHAPVGYCTMWVEDIGSGYTKQTCIYRDAQSKCNMWMRVWQYGSEAPSWEKFSFDAT